MTLTPSGCRENASTENPAPPSAVILSFATGDRFTYDTWTLDEFGYLVSSSKATSQWRVISTTQVWSGRSGVIMMVDSNTTLKDTSLVVDTLYFSITAGGDVFQYGFLSELAARRLKRTIPQQWDCIAAFSQNFRTSWRVGVLDSAGREPVYGMISGAQEMFSTKVDGVQMVFPAYRVDLEGTSLTLMLRISEAPSALLEAVEEPQSEHRGFYRNLREMAMAPRVTPSIP